MLLKIMQFYMPEYIKKIKLKEMFHLTAQAFQSELPELNGLSFAECLTKYALFTKEQALGCLQSRSVIEEVKDRLYRNSYVFGQSIKKSLHIKTWEEAVAALKLAYELIGIDFRYDKQGEFVIKQCFFSKFYSKDVCKFISSMDEGLAAGLSDGGQLSFNQRITEGCYCCKGYLIKGL